MLRWDCNLGFGHKIPMYIFIPFGCWLKTLAMASSPSGRRRPQVCSACRGREERSFHHIQAMVTDRSYALSSRPHINSPQFWALLSILNGFHGKHRCSELSPERVHTALCNTLQELQVDYLDLYLVIAGLWLCSVQLTYQDSLFHEIASLLTNAVKSRLIGVLIGKCNSCRFNGLSIWTKGLAGLPSQVRYWSLTWRVFGDRWRNLLRTISFGTSESAISPSRSSGSWWILLKSCLRVSGEKRKRSSDFSDVYRWWISQVHSFFIARLTDGDAPRMEKW